MQITSFPGGILLCQTAPRLNRVSPQMILSQQERRIFDVGARIARPLLSDTLNQIALVDDSRFSTQLYSLGHAGVRDQK